MKTKPFIVFTIVFIGLFLVAFVMNQAGKKLIIYNPSESVPRGFYYYAGMSFKKGDLVLFPVPAIVTEYVAKNYGEKTLQYFVKPVLAMNEEHICFKEENFELEGEFLADIRLNDSQGKPLPLWKECRNLAGNEVFVFADRIENSFDSRYYGPIKKEQIIGVYKPLWVTEKEY